MTTQPGTSADALAGAHLPATPGSVGSLFETRACRGDVFHRPRRIERSPLERICRRHAEIAERHRRESEARHRILVPLVGALMRVIPVPAAASASSSDLGAEARGVGGARVGEAIGDSHNAATAESLEAAMDVELRVVEAVERAKAALDAQALVALARMQSLAESMVAAAPAAARAVPVSHDELVTMEVSTATGLSQSEIAVRAELATGPVERFGALREMLAAGTVSLRRACQVVEETRHLQHEAVAELVESVFAPTRDGAGLSGNLFRQRLRRGILRADADAAAAAARRRAARRRNGARAQIFDDGTGELVVRNDAEKIAAAIDRADAAARAAKAGGDPRSLDQLRADFITGAASYGQPCVTGGCGSTTGPLDQTPSADAESGGDGKVGTDGEDGRQPHRCQFVPDWYASFGHRPAAKVWIVVPITTALGLDEAPCQLPGHGWIAAEQARAIVTAEGSIWQTMLADLDTGAALRLWHRGYRPTTAMVEHVSAVDGVCRGPGCTVPASRCDVDHDIPYPEGPTDVSNLTDKHRQHHRIRTAGFWRAVRDPNDARVTWRTSAGRRYVTYPADWLEDVRPRRKFGGYDHNPEPESRPYGPEPNPDPSAGGADRSPEPPPF